LRLPRRPRIRVMRGKFGVVKTNERKPAKG
jgi:hypothetical protein